MYTLVDGISTMNSSFDILVIGQHGVGKSTMLRKYVLGPGHDAEFDSSECLIYKTMKKLGHSNSGMFESTNSLTAKRISILDSSAGVDTLLTYNAYQVNNAQSILFTYSADSQESFQYLEYTIHWIQARKGRLPPCVVVGLKRHQDYLGQVSASQGEALATSCGALHFAEINLYDDRPVDNVFEPLVDLVLYRREQDCSSESSLSEKSKKHSSVSIGGSFSSHGETLVNSKTNGNTRCFEITKSNTDFSFDQDEFTYKDDEFVGLTKTEKPNRTYTRRRSSQQGAKKSKVPCCIIM